MAFSGISLRDLEYVVAVADRGSFVAAAEQCRVSQPSLSAQVRKIETWLGTALFERTTRRVMITATGRRFIEQARVVLEEAGKLALVAQPAGRPFGGTLRLSAIATTGPYFFPRMLGELRRCYPDLTMVLGEGLTEALVTSLRAGDLDAVLLSTPFTDPSLAFAAIYREPFLLACPAGFGGDNPAEDLWTSLPAAERLLLGEGHCLRHQTLALCSDVGLRDRHGTSLETLKYMIAAGEGCTLMPALAAKEGAGVRYAPLPSPGYSREIALAWRRSDPRTDDYRDLAASLRTIVATYIPELEMLPGPA